MPSARRPKKSVRFAPSSASLGGVATSTVSIPSHVDMSKDEKQARYWTTEEVAQILRMGAKFAVRDLKRQATDEIAQIEDIYQTVLDTESVLSTEQQVTVQHFQNDSNRCLIHQLARASSMETTHGLVVRGLERYVSKTMLVERGDIAMRARQDILLAASVCGDDTDALARHCQQISRSAVMYARLVGLADAQVVIDQGQPPQLQAPQLLQQSVQESFSARKKSMSKSGRPTLIRGNTMTDSGRLLVVRQLSPRMDTVI